MRATYTLLFLLLSHLIAAQQICPVDSFQFADAIDAPKFRNAPISPRDQPKASTDAFLPQDGIDAGEYVELTQVQSYEYRITAERPFFTTALSSFRNTTGIIDNTGSSFPSTHNIYLVPHDCGLFNSRQNNSNDGLRISCHNCPELPYRPQSATIDEYVVDSSQFYLVPQFYFSNYRGGQPDVIGQLSPLEQRAWSKLNPIHSLADVQRSKPFLFTAPPRAEELHIRLSDVVFNTDYYELTKLADGIGASLVGYTRTGNQPEVIAADYRKFLTLQTDRSMQLTLDLTQQDERYRNYAVLIWRVAAVREVNPPAIGTFRYPGNYIRFQFGLDTPRPPLPAPPHDVCSTARTIPYHPVENFGPELLDTISIAGATPSPGLSTNCGGGNDVWLTFVAESTQHEFYAVDSDTGQLTQAFELYRGDCNDLTFLNCFTPVRGGQEVTTLTDLVVGARYFIRLPGQTTPIAAQNDVHYALFGAGTGCTTIQASLIGTECVDAFNYRATVRITSMVGQPAAYIVNVGDTLLTVAGPGDYTVRTSPSALRILGSGACDGPELPARTDACFTNQNDECTGAFTVPLSPVDNPVFAIGSTNLRTVSSSDSLSGSLPADCGGVAGAADVWFVAINPGPVSTSLGFTLRDITPGQTTYATYFYAGECGALRYLTCSKSGYVEVPDVPPGGKIFLRSARITSRFASFHTGFRIAAHPLNAVAEVDCDQLRSEQVEGGRLVSWTLLAPPVNLSGWIIQTSTNASDWQTLPVPPSVVVSADSLSYQALVPLAVAGIVFIRVLSVSTSGVTQQVCGLISATEQPPLLPLGVFPNPVAAGQSLTVTLDEPGTDSGILRLTDGLGRSIPVYVSRQSRGWTLTVPERLSPGVYFLSVTVGRRTGYQRLLVH